MLPNDPGEFERRLTAGDFDAAIHRILSEPDLDESDGVTSGKSVPASDDATLKQILDKGRRLGRSRLWVARQFAASRLHSAVRAEKADLSVTLVGPPSAASNQDDLGAVSTSNGLFRIGASLQLRFGADFNGAPLELVLVAAPKVTRVEFDELIGFEKPRVALAPRESGNRPERAPAMALDIPLTDATTEPSEEDFPMGNFDVVVDFAASQLEVSTERLEGEDGILIATVQFDGGIPIPVILECKGKDRTTLRGTVPLPPAVKEGREKAAIVVVHEVVPEELPLLNPTEASLWLAGQHAMVIPLSEDQSGFDFTLDEGDRRFLVEKPDAIVAVRVEQQTSEVGR